MAFDPVMLAGVVLVLLAVILALFVTFRPRYADIHVSRRRPYPAKKGASGILRVSDAAVAAVGRHMSQRTAGPFGREALRGAGIKTAPADFTILMMVAGFLLAVAGLIIQGPLVALLFAGLSPAAAFAFIKFRTGRRRAAFEDQLSDMLMSLSGSLRSGHSITQSMHSASVEMPPPMSEELARIVNEDRVGRDTSASMAEVGQRMQCEDFEWLSQAIDINREVGGDLAGVLDHVAETVRERAQIKGQVRALAAEGKFSAYILIALPFCVGAFINMSNPGYMAVLFQTALGWALIGAAVIMMAIGSFWISRMVKIEF